MVRWHWHPSDVKMGYNRSLKTSSLISAEYLFVVGGSHNYQKAELVALSEEGPVPECLSDLKEHPNKVYLAAGGALADRGGEKLYAGVEPIPNISVDAVFRQSTPCLRELLLSF